MSRSRIWLPGGLLALAVVACTAGGKDDDTDAVDTDVETDTDVVVDDSDSDVVETDDVDSDTDTDSDTDLDASVSPCGSAVGTVTVGTGTNAYAAVTEGAELFMVHGPQGGWHFDLAVAVTDTPRFVSIEHTLTRVSDGQVISAGPLSGAFRDNKGVVGTATDDCVADGSVFGLRSILDTNVLGEEPWTTVCGEELRYDVKILWSWCARYDDLGCADMRDVVVAMDSLTFIGQPDPSDAAACAAP